MLNNPPKVTLLAPGCFSMVAQSEDSAEQPLGEPVHSEPQIEVNDSTAITTATSIYEQALADALNQPIPEIGHLPSALYQYEYGTGNSLPEHCVCAELVHLQTSSSNARLVPAAALKIDDDEADQLLGSLNELLKADGIEAHRGEDGRCYLTGMPASILDTWPAHAVANGKVANYLPRHTEAGEWRRLMTEVQMLFHTHPVNAMRAELRQLPINSMWFWGGNQNVAVAPVSDSVLFADDAYAIGLSDSLRLDVNSAADSSWSQIIQAVRQSAATFDSQAATPAAIQAATQATSENKQINNIVIADHTTYDAWLRNDFTALAAAKQQLQKKWIEPIQAAVANGLVSEFVLDGCEGQAIVERKAAAIASTSVLQSLLDKLSLGRLFQKQTVKKDQ